MTAGCNAGSEWDVQEDRCSGIGVSCLTMDGPCTDSRLIERVARCLHEHEVLEPNEENAGRIAAEIRASLGWRRKWLRQLEAPQRLDRADIVWSIAAARDGGDRDEALWRGFLAGHFGRPSARPGDARRVASAGRFLNGFGDSPLWTWVAVSSDLGILDTWLRDHAQDLAGLRFGNHRKYESSQPGRLFEVIVSFAEWVRRSGGSPAEAFNTNVDSSPALAFDRLYRGLSSVRRFGRTASFDTLLLLADMRLLDVSPGSCYLAGATGPLRGAEELWGLRPVAELERLTAALAGCLDLPLENAEDVLCNWQKRQT